MSARRQSRKIIHPRLTITEDAVPDTGMKVLKVLFFAGRPMTDTQIHERARFVWGEDGRSHAAIWRARVRLADLGLVVDSGHPQGRSIMWGITPQGREFTRRYG